jgi:uncharacterized protein YndB with AHSA1/START domain
MFKTTVDRSTLTLTFQRAFPVSRERVFDAWTIPEQVAQWWDPDGVPLTECRIDLRPGGSFTFANRGNAHSPPFTGTYRLIERPSELVFDALGAVGTVKLRADTASSTHMTVTIRCGSAEHLEQFLKLGVHTNTDRTFDNLVAHLKRG